MSHTKRGYLFRVGGVPIKGRSSHSGYREMFEDRQRSRDKSLKKLWELQHKQEAHEEYPDKYQPLTLTESRILESMKEMQNRPEWKESTDAYRRLCVGPTGTMERYAPLKYRTRSKEIGHPEDSTFRKKVKCLNDDGRLKLENKKNRKNRVQAIA